MCGFHICRVRIVFSKKKSTWRIYVGYSYTDLNSAHDCDCVWWTACIDAKRLDGNSQVPYLNWNGDKRNLNANDVRNDWNDRNRFVFVRNLISLHSAKALPSHYSFLCISSSCLMIWLAGPSSADDGHLHCSSLFDQPPSIFPISCNFSPRAMYCLVSKELMVCATRRSTFAVSRVWIAFCIYANFCSFFTKSAEDVYAMTSHRSVSIFAPREYL